MSESKIPRLDNDAIAAQEDENEKIVTILQRIDDVQNNLNSLNEKASEEILAVEHKYTQLRQPHYDSRSKIIDGIPGFWVTCLTNHSQSARFLTETDLKILQHLVKLEVQEFDDVKSGYEIHFHFEGNPYFKNSVLTKEFSLSTSPVFHNTPIDWHPGMKPNQAANDTSAGSVEEGFFMWFESVENSRVNIEFGDLIKDEIWPNPVQFFFEKFGSEDDYNADDDDNEDDVDEQVQEEPAGEDANDTENL